MREMTIFLLKHLNFTEKVQTVFTDFFKLQIENMVIWVLDMRKVVIIRALQFTFLIFPVSFYIIQFLKDKISNIIVD